MLMAVGGGCTTEPASRNAPRSAASGVPRAPNQLPLPISRYLATTDEQRLVSEALITWTEQCALRGGVDVKLPRLFGRHDTGENRRYGVIDRRVAADRGYRPLDAGGSAAEFDLSLTARQNVVLYGRSGRPAGPKSQQGCFSKAADALKLNRASLELAHQLDISTAFEARKEPAVRAAFRRWAACMTRHGHAQREYNDPWDPPGDSQFQRGEPSHREIAVALDDVRCKRLTEVVAVWHAHDVRLQTEAIDKFALRLARERAAFLRVVARAQQIVEGDLENHSRSVG